MFQKILLIVFVIIIFILNTSIYAQENWTILNSGTSKNIRDIAYGNGTLVAVGEAGLVCTSTNNGQTWTVVNTGITGTLQVVDFGNSAFVAVEATGLYTSTDNGKTWTKTNSSSYVDVAFGNGIFVAIGNTSTKGILKTSTDGMNWTSQNPNPDTNGIHSWEILSDITFANGKFEIVGRGLVIITMMGVSIPHQHEGFIMDSNDGKKWGRESYGDWDGTSKKYKYLKFVHDLTNKFNLFVAIGESNSIYTSTSFNWTAQTTGTNYYSIAWGKNLLVAVGEKGAICSSGNAKDWTRRNSPTTKSLRSILITTDSFFAVGDNGCIIKSGETTQAPTADFTANPTSGTAPLTVQFNNASSGDITSYFWDFGDGQTSTSKNPSHAYQNAGAYTVKLTVTGPGGSNTKTRTNYINVTSAATLIADFSGTPTSGTAPLTVQFTDQSTGNITSRLWDFGDGQTSGSTNPSHIYQNAGTYTVKLTVTGPGGSNNKIRNNYINVNKTQESFVDIRANLTPMKNGSASWGDYNNDGYLDILMTGIDASERYYAIVYKNNGNGTFTNINAGLTPGAYCNTCWVDSDNDGDLDIQLMEWSGSQNILNIYRNDGNNSFVKLNTNLTSEALGSHNSAWGDYDNDGDLDVVFSVYWSGGSDIKLFRNDGNHKFTYINVEFTKKVGDGFLYWGDYDKDGDLDLLVTGRDNTSVYSKIYRNNGNDTFSDIGANLKGLYCNVGQTKGVPFGDYDNDGDLDLVLSGLGDVSSDSRYTIIYRNNGNGTFTDIKANLIGTKQGCVAWGDYDNDGDLDLLISGFNGTMDMVKLYRNDGNNKFTEVVDNFPDAVGPCAWGDYDNDNDLDILFVGWDGAAENYFAKIYRNEISKKNTKPNRPTNLSSNYKNGNLILTWNLAADNETPSAGLSYNIRVGTTSGGNDIISGCSNLNGHRMLSQLGNVQMNKTWTIKNLKNNNKYYWSVQAIDGCFAGSEWAETAIVTSVENEESRLPFQFSFLQNYPNPFNPNTTISFMLAEPSDVCLQIFDVSGKLVRILLNDKFEAGHHFIEWNSRDTSGNNVSSGIYFYSIRTKDTYESRKMMLVR